MNRVLFMVVNNIRRVNIVVVMIRVCFCDEIFLFFNMKNCV